MQILSCVALCCVFTQARAQEPDTTLKAKDSLNALVPSVSVSFDALDNQLQTQDVSGLLQTSRDVFNSVAGYNFSAARYRLRGYDSENFAVMMNGAPVNDPETGWAIFGMWGGLNDVTRYPENQFGIAGSQWGFGGAGGWTNYNLRAADDRPGGRVSYAYTNRSYRHRIMGSYSSGLNKKGWAYTVAISRRWAKEGYVDGTYYDALGYFVTVDKKISEKHSISLTGFAAPTVQGRQGIAVQEAYDLTDNPYYNPYWGYQNGEKRNSRVRHNHKPHIFLSHDWKKDKDMWGSNTGYFFFGRTGNTNLNWYDAADPRPDYYRYLPSYYTLENPAEAAKLTARWENNITDNTQINWDNMYFANSKNLYALPDGTGDANRSKYIIEEYRVDPIQAGISSFINKNLNEHMLLSAGVNAEYYVSRNFKLMKDLLGGDFWIDVDQFAEQQYEDPNAAKNDLNNEFGIVREGDEFGYNYNIHQYKAKGFAQLEMKYSKLDAFVGLMLGYTSFWRDGKYQNGRFPDNSFGKSDPNSFFNYGLKGGATYKITGRHYVSVNALTMSRAPFANNAYIAPRIRDHVVSGLKSNVITAADINYNARYGNLKARVTGYYTTIVNQTWSRSFYHDIYRTFVNYTMTGLNEMHMGVETGISYTLAQVLEINAVFGTGDYIYTSRPLATISADNDNKLLAEDRLVYLKNYKVGGAPQTVASIGLRYNSPKFWFVGVSFNYFANNYMDPNPDRRTAEATEGYITSDPQWDDLLIQEQLDNGYTLDAFAGYSYRTKKRDFIRVNLSVSNILNDKTVRTGGFEQLRYDPADIAKFPPKYSYMFGTSIFAMLTYQF
jgi:hypothetical protein